MHKSRRASCSKKCKSMQLTLAEVNTLKKTFKIIDLLNFLVKFYVHLIKILFDSKTLWKTSGQNFSLCIFEFSLPIFNKAKESLFVLLCNIQTSDPLF